MSSIESVMNETRIFEPAEAFKAQANVTGMEGYRALCEQADKDYEGFWAGLARELLVWKKPFTKVLDESNAPFYKWFDDGEMNVSYNCLDKHLATQPDKTAIIFEADDGKVTKITYQDLYHRVCQFANGLKSRGIEEGRPRHHLHADEHRGGGGDAGLRPHRRDPLGGVRRLLRQEPARTHHRCERQCGHHRRRPVCAAARRCRSNPRWTRRSPWAAANACTTWWCTAHRRRSRRGMRSATCGGTIWSRARPIPANRNG